MAALRSWFSILTVSVVLLCGRCGMAQEPGPSPAPMDQAADAEKPSLPVDDQASPLAEPRFSLQTLRVSGAATGDYAELTFELEVVVRRGGWVRIPVRLGEGIVRGRAEFSGGGDQFLHFEDQRGGFQWYLNDKLASADKARRHKATIHMSIPLENVAGETRLRFTAPRCTSSQLSLSVPGKNVVGGVLGGKLIDEPVVRAGVTQFQVVGLDGQFTITWHAAARRPVRASADLQVETTLACRIREGVVRTEAKLVVRSFGAEFERFRVRLPPGTELVNDDPRIELVSGDEPRGGPPMVEVRHERTTGPVEVRFATLRAYDVDAGGAAKNVELAGFDVVGAVRQFGHIALQTEGDRQVFWDRLHPSVQQIPVGDLPESLRGQRFSAAWRFWRQEASLQVQIVRRQTRIRVEPEYRYSVSHDEIRLDARLKYQVRGSSVFSLQVEMPSAAWSFRGTTSAAGTITCAPASSSGCPKLTW